MTAMLNRILVRSGGENQKMSLSWSQAKNGAHTRFSIMSALAAVSKQTPFAATMDLACSTTHMAALESMLELNIISYTFCHLLIPKISVRFGLEYRYGDKEISNILERT
jgi:hypothetical protein